MLEYKVFPIKMHRSLKWFGAAALSLIVVLVLFVALFDWNWLRDPIAREISRRTGRSFAINGDLNVHLALQPRVVAHDIVLGNAAWSREPSMVTIRRLEFRIDLLKLMAGQVAFPQVALSDPHVVLEVSQDGKPNWSFNQGNKNKPINLPTIDALTIDQGSVAYRDPNRNTDMALEIKALQDPENTRESTLQLAGKGRYKRLPVMLQARGGALLSLRTADHPYPVHANGMLGATKVSIDGMLLDPLHFKGEQLSFTLEGSDLGLLYPIIGVPLPPTPAYKLAGFLDHAGDVWAFRRFNGTMGQSDLAGDFSVDRGKRPQKISADIVSKKLFMKDLGGFIGADRGANGDRTELSSDRVLPAELFSLEKLRAADADVHFRGEKILTEKMLLQKMSVHLTVNNGVLRLAPLDFGIAGGNLISTIEMDGRGPRIVTHADIAAKGLHLDQMFPASKLAEVNTGMMGGRAKLDGNGNSVAQILAAANGEAALIMDGGSVSELMLRLSNLDIANSLWVLLGGDKQVPIRCLVGNFKAVHGDFKVEALVLDTTKVNITGSGDVDFTDESLHLRLVAQSKGFSLASLRGPVAITGSFRSPLVRPEAGGALTRGGLAVAMGAATAGIGALIPLLDFGQDQDSNCIALMGQAKSDAGVKASDMAPRVRK